jgi:L,D-peptidoglycan transpeptidase YkuD (ErfK/YbiS/YcfS/YnhG family)
MFHAGNAMTAHRPALRMFSRLLSITAALLLASCAHRPAGEAQATRWQHAGQLVLVTTADWNSDHGTLRSYSRTDGGDWHPTGAPFPVVIGRAGAAWGIGLHDVPQGSDGPVKQEGDGRSPAGVFAIGEAFGYAQSVDTALPYVAMQASDYCVDVSGSPLYNRIVDANEVGADAVKDSTEPMRRDLHADGDQRYRQGFVIEHNPQGKPAAGSCIFAHLWKSPDSTTAGCTAMDPAAMRSLLAWLDAKQRPVFVLLPQSEYDRLHAAWQLPAL